MLRSLYIKNYAIIDEIQLDFADDLNIITGETGAGKSIMLGALKMLLGERASTNQYPDNDEKSVIEGTFDIGGLGLQDFFEQNELEYNDQTIIRRELLPGGKSRSFVNDSPANLNVLLELRSSLIDIHSQHDSLELRSNEFQLRVVDAFADHASLLTEYKKKYLLLKEKKKTYDELNENKEKIAKEKDFIAFQLEELNQYPLDTWDQEIIEQDLSKMEHAEEIKKTLYHSTQVIDHQEGSLLDILQEILSSQRKVEKYAPELQSKNNSLEAIVEELKEWSKDISRSESDIEYNADRIQSLREDLDSIYKLLKKHHKGTLEELKILKGELEVQLHQMEHSDDYILQLKEELKREYKECLSLAEQISHNRKNAIPFIEKQLLDNLKYLQLDNSQFKIWINTSPEIFKETGIDEVRYLFSANMGKEPQELKNAISGGEMSRFMLSIKSMMAQKIKLPTLIFDEIDTGVSGDVAYKVANNLEFLSQNHQIIAITHLPQIASKGQSHLFVYKTIKDNKSISYIKKLNKEERIHEVAKMLSGASITERSLANAKELLG
jgi:DNA repair protein RecN (Recombination protein N)